MIVIVCGGRDYRAWIDFKIAMHEIHKERPITAVIAGGDSGADTFAQWWAKMMNVEFIHVPADWKKRGRAAGPIRNSEMLKLNPDAVIAFPGGRGTADMVRKAKAAGVEVIEP